MFSLLVKWSACYTGWSKSLCAPDDYSIRTVPTQLMIWRWPSQNTFEMWTLLYWTQSSRTQFSLSINVWRLAGDTLNITCKFLYYNHQVHGDFLSPCILQSIWKQIQGSVMVMYLRRKTLSGHDWKILKKDSSWKVYKKKRGK